MNMDCRGFELVTKKNASYALANAIVNKLKAKKTPDTLGYYSYDFVKIVDGERKVVEVKHRRNGNSYEFIVGNAQTFVVTPSNIDFTLTTLIKNVPQYMLYESCQKSFTGEFYPFNALDLISALGELTNGEISTKKGKLKITRENNTIFLTITTEDDVEHIEYSVSDIGSSLYKSSSNHCKGSICIMGSHKYNYLDAALQVMLDVVTILENTEGSELFEDFKKLAPNGFYVI